MWKFSVVLLVAALVAGCTGMTSESSFGPHFGELELGAMDATSTYSALQGTAAAHVAATLTGNNTGAIVASAYLIGAACPLGPVGTPEEWLARADLPLPDLGNAPVSKQVELSVEGAVTAGTRYSVIFDVDAENVIGPIFGKCQDFLATP